MHSEQQVPYLTDAQRLSSEADTLVVAPSTTTPMEQTSSEVRGLLPIISPTEVTWPEKKDAVDLLQEGKYVPVTRADALWLIRQRFGCAYQWLPEEYQVDPEIIMEAAVLSAGHTLAYVPEAAWHLLDPEFFRKAFERGVMPWAVKYASDEMQKDPVIESLRAETDKQLFTKYADILKAARSGGTDAEYVW